MYRVMTMEELKKNESILSHYGCIEVKENDKTLGIFIPPRYAQSAKEHINKLKEKGKK